MNRSLLCCLVWLALALALAMRCFAAEAQYAQLAMDQNLQQSPKAKRSLRLQAGLGGSNIGFGTSLGVQIPLWQRDFLHIAVTSDREVQFLSGLFGGPEKPDDRAYGFQVYYGKELRSSILHLQAALGGGVLTVQRYEQVDPHDSWQGYYQSQNESASCFATQVQGGIFILPMLELFTQGEWLVTPDTNLFRVSFMIGFGF